MLKLENVALKLGTNQYHYSLQATSDRVSAILGKSGSGKSTLLNVIAGFLRADAGELYWHDTALNALNANERPVTTLFQHHNLFTHLNVKQNIGLGINPNLKLSAEDTQNIQAVLSEVGMGDYATTNAAQLSGGEQQRVALARCLLRKQPILLLDEPFSALDESTRHDMIKLTARVIQDHKLCVVLVTHNEDDANLLGAIKYDLHQGQLTQRTAENHPQTL